MKSTGNRPYRFSLGGCILFGSMHFIGTLLLAGTQFLNGMGAFTEDMSTQVMFTRIIQWAWSPLAMAASARAEGVNLDELLGWSALWSACVGVLFGFVVARLRKWLDRPLYP